MHKYIKKSKHMSKSYTTTVNYIEIRMRSEEKFVMKNMILKMKIKGVFFFFRGPILNPSPDFVFQAIQDYLSKTKTKKQTNFLQPTHMQENYKPHN